MKVNPRRITAALDVCGLYGPHVDAALDVEEPTVDMWEAGRVEPTAAQIARLAMLTGFPVGWFFRKDEFPQFTHGFICSRRGPCLPLVDDEPSVEQGALW